MNRKGHTFESGWQVARVGGADADIALPFGLLGGYVSGAEENTDLDELLEKSYMHYLEGAMVEAMAQNHTIKNMFE